MKEKTKSFRLTEEECTMLDDMQERTGLSISALIKKSLFQEAGSNKVNTDILLYLGEISTAINKLKNYNEDDDIKPYINQIEGGTEKLWQIL